MAISCIFGSHNIAELHEYASSEWNFVTGTNMDTLVATLETMAPLMEQIPKTCIFCDLFCVDSSTLGEVVTLGPRVYWSFLHRSSWSSKVTSTERRSDRLLNN